MAADTLRGLSVHELFNQLTGLLATDYPLRVGDAIVTGVSIDGADYAATLTTESEYLTLDDAVDAIKDVRSILEDFRNECDGVPLPPIPVVTAIFKILDRIDVVLKPWE